MPECLPGDQGEQRPNNPSIGIGFHANQAQWQLCEECRECRAIELFVNHNPAVFISAMNTDLVRSMPMDQVCLKSV